MLMTIVLAQIVRHTPPVRGDVGHLRMAGELQLLRRGTQPQRSHRRPPTLLVPNRPASGQDAIINGLEPEAFRQQAVADLACAPRQGEPHGLGRRSGEDPPRPGKSIHQHEATPAQGVQ